MDTMLRKALWGFLRPLVQLVTNLINPEIGEEWEREFKKFLRKDPCWVKEVQAQTIEVCESKPDPTNMTCSVDRNRSFQDAIMATGRKPYLSLAVVATCPKVMGDFKGSFVKIGKFCKSKNLALTLKVLGWRLIEDPQGLADLNAKYPDFADRYPNATQWQDAHGKYCYATFDRFDSDRNVLVGQYDDGWDDGWFFPCESIST